MIGKKKLEELRKEWSDDKPWDLANCVELMDTIEALWKDNAELQERHRLAVTNQWRVEKLEAVARAAKALKDCPFCGLGGKVDHDPGCVLAALEGKV